LSGRGGIIAVACHGRGGGLPERGENGVSMGLVQCALLLHGRRNMGNSLKASLSGGEVRVAVLGDGLVVSCFGAGASAGGHKTHIFTTNYISFKI
jgi:hypothetical protein